MAKIWINGKLAQAEEGANLLETLSKHNAEVPHLCYDKRLGPSSTCRLCEVKIEGQEHLQCACSTPVKDGMKVVTDTPELEHYRKSILEHMARKQPESLPDYVKFTPLQKYFDQYKITERAGDYEDGLMVDSTHPYIDVDMQRCIHCFRCVHICADLQGQFVWKVFGRGSHSRIWPDLGKSLLDGGCVSCGACVDTCPTGALEDKNVIAHGLPDKVTRSVCPYCGVGCEISVGTKNDKIVSIKPVLDSPVNKGHLCVKGRYGHDFVDADDRVLSPMIKVNGTWKKVSWDEALDAAVESLNSIKQKLGADAIGVLASARATNEDSFLAQKFARLVLGTNNVDCCARVCHAPTAAGMARVFGTGAATNCFDDIEKASMFLLIGTNPTENHPIVGARIKQRVLKGVPLVVVDPRKTELTEHAKIHLAIKPGTNIPLINSLLHVIFKEKLADTNFIKERTSGIEELQKMVEAWTPERAATICGVSAQDIRAVARLYAQSKPAMCFHGLGVTENIQGTEGVMNISNLALVTGNIGKEGSGVNPLRGQNNVQGTAVMGCEPNRLVGSQKYEVAGSAHQKLWGIAPNGDRGLTMPRMMKAAGEGKLKSLMVIGYDIYLSNPNAHETKRQMQNLDSVIVIDLFLNETAREFGTIFLPACSSFEKDGTFMNSERRIQRVREAIPARGESKPDWEIMCLLAQKMGHEKHFKYASPSEIWDEIRQLWPAAQGISYERLEGDGLQWPCPTTEHPGTSILHTKAFPIGPQAKLKAIDYVPSSEQPSSEFPLILNTGRTLYHFNAATMTGHSQNKQIESDEWVQVHPQDARKLGIEEGKALKVESRFGSFMGIAKITDKVRVGECFAIFHNAEAMVNHVTGLGMDPYADTPEYKVTAVRIMRT